MDDIHITVHHNAHWEWVRASDVRADEETRPLHPLAPDLVLVKRLVEGASTTEVVIPGESAARMAAEQAAAEGAPAVADRHLHEILTRHLRDTLHDDHAPLHAWERVETDDEALQKVLHSRLVGS